MIFEKDKIVILQIWQKNYPITDNHRLLYMVKDVFQT